MQSSTSLLKPEKWKLRVLYRTLLARLRFCDIGVTLQVTQAVTMYVICHTRPTNGRRQGLWPLRIPARP